MAVPILPFADSDVRRRGELRGFFSNSGLLVAAAADGLGCLAELVALEADVLVIALEIPWAGGDRGLSGGSGGGTVATVQLGLPRAAPCFVRFPRRRLSLRGQVLSFHLKPVSHEFVRRLDGAEVVNDHLEVVAPPCPP